MAAIIVSTPHSDSVTSAPLAQRTGYHRLIILHAEHDGDEMLVDLTRRLGDGDRMTLANLRPTAPATVPPCYMATELGMVVYVEARDAHSDSERHLDLRIAARSRLLKELGVAHDVVTETYHRSVVGRVTARNLRKAMGRIANRARADEIIVGPGAILEIERSG